MHLGGVASPAFADILVVAGTVLVCFHIAAINEDPFQIGVCFQHVEELFPEVFFRPVIVSFVDRIPFAEMVWQISPVRILNIMPLTVLRRPALLYRLN